MSGTEGKTPWLKAKIRTGTAIVASKITSTTNAAPTAG